MLKKFFSGLTAVLMLSLAFSSVEAKSDNNYRVSELSRLNEEETINGDYFATGERVEILGNVNGDVYAAGGMILIEGQVNGDVLVAGGTVDITGKITQDVRAAGGEVTIRGMVEGSATVLSGNFSLDKEAVVKGGVVALGGNIDLRGPVGKSSKFGAGNLFINSSVGSDVDAAVGNLRISKEASISGNLTYWSEEQADIDSSASISGTISRQDPPKFDSNGQFEESSKAFFKGFSFFAQLSSLLTTLIVGLLFTKFFPRYQKEATLILDKNVGKVLLYGAISLVLVPAVLLITFITIFGIPLATIGFVVFTLFAYFARITIMVWVGAKVLNMLNQKGTLTGHFLLGLAAYYLVAMIPVLGGLMKLATLVLGLGVGILMKKHIYEQGVKKELF